VAALAAAVLLLAFGLRVWGLDRVPPGLHVDEAVYGLMARDIVAGARPVFFSAYTGREPLFMYLMAGLFSLVGDGAWALRLTSAAAGTLTVALAFALARALYGPRVGLVSAALLAVHYGHLTVSRNGYPNVLIPPLEALSALLLYLAWRAGGRVTALWALGGAAAGLVLYTYLSARFWPLFLLVFLGYLLATHPRAVLRRLPGIALAALACAAVFAPLGAHFLRQPADFVERANQVLAWQELSGAAWLQATAGNLWQTLRGLVTHGDPRWHFNLPGRPVFLPWLAVPLLLGTALCARRWRRPRYALPLLWVLVLVLPGVLTLELQPAGQRIFGVFPALVFLPALGLVAIAERLAARTPRAGRAAVLAVGLAAVVTVDAAVTARHYFGRWAVSPETRFLFNGDHVALAGLVAPDLEAGETVLLLTEHYKHATLAFLAPAAVEGAVWADPRLAIPLPVPREGARRPEVVAYRLRAWLPDDAPGARWLEATAVSSDTWRLAPPFPGEDGAVHLEVIRYVLPAAPAAARAGAYLLGDEVLAWPAPAPVSTPRNAPLVVPVTWQVAAGAGGARSLALHLRDEHGTTWAQADQMGYLAEQWRPGDRVQQWFRLPLDPTMPPGAYTAHLILTDEGGRALPVSGPRTAWAPSAPVAAVRVLPEGRRRAAENAVPLHVFPDGLALMAGMGSEPIVPPGASLDLELLWARWGDRPAERVTLTLDGPDGRRELAVVAVAAPDYPPAAWRERELARARYRLRLPADVAPGRHRLLAATGHDAVAVAVGRVTVAVDERRFSAPATAHATEAAFGPLRLLGYDLEPARPVPGGQVTVRLVWQATSTPEGEAKVFVHLYAPDGRLVAQHDGPPAQGGRPLTGWLPGEVVVDAHVVDLPRDLAPGSRLTVAVGLYDPLSGQRWPLVAVAPTAGDHALRLRDVILGGR